jgi:hypothetical protein
MTLSAECYWSAKRLDDKVCDGDLLALRMLAALPRSPYISPCEVGGGAVGGCCSW